jgi:signal peptidase I
MEREQQIQAQPASRIRRLAAKIAVVISLMAILVAVFGTYCMPSPSMLPTIQRNDRLIVNKVWYGIRDPKRNDIVVFSIPPSAAKYMPNARGDAFVKRIVAIPGDDVRMANGRLYLYGRGAQPEPFIKNGYRRTIPDPTGANPDDDWFQMRPANLVKHGGVYWIHVPPGQYFVLGDNRNDSMGSHVFGFIPRSNIIGKVTTRFLPTIGDLR